jgi:tetratricopeptide (TPR) repeat protein
MNQRLVAIVCACAVLAGLCWPPSLGARREAWVEVRSPNFIIVSNAGEKQARKTAIQFEQIHSLFRDTLAVAQGHPSPLITILAVKDEKSLSELLPEYWTKGHAHPSGLFIDRLNQYYAAVNLDAQGTNPYATMYHEYYHSLTIPYFPDLPVWLSEGLADFFGHSEIVGNTAMMGMADPDLIEQLRQTKLIPLDVLFRVDNSSPYYNEQNKTSVFYAESWALTHFLMIGDNQSHRQMLLDYASALSSGATHDQATAKAFGDLKKLQDQLSRYIEKFSFYYFQTKAPAETSAADLRTRTLSDAEVEAYRGGFFAVRGRPEAKEILQNAVNLDPKLALAHQNLGLAEFFEGNRDSALASISEAVQLDPKNGLTRYLRAYLSYAGATGFPQNAQIEEDLRQSIAASPDFAPAYALLGIYLAGQSRNLDEAFKLSSKAVALEPGSSQYMFYLAQVLMQMQRLNDAQYVALRARANAKTSQERANVDALLQTLEAVRSARHDSAAPEQPENAASGSTPDAENPRANAPGNTKQISGVAANGGCAQGLLQFDVKTSSGSIRISAPRHGNYGITSEGGLEKDFNPCSSLNGRNVTVDYIPDGSTGAAGILEVIRVVTPSELTTEAPSERGTVANVVCTGHEMRLTLTTDSGAATFRASDFTKLRYLAGASGVFGSDLDPCADLKGRAAKVIYEPGSDRTFKGEMQTIVIGKRAE